MLHGSAQCILKKTQGVSLNKINKINSIFTLDQLCKAATKITLIYVHPCFKRILMKHTEKKSSLTSVINKHIFFCLNLLFIVLDKKIIFNRTTFFGFQHCREVKRKQMSFIIPLYVQIQNNTLKFLLMQCNFPQPKRNVKLNV